MSSLAPIRGKRCGPTGQIEGFLSRNEGAGLSHENQHGNLAHIRRFTGHVRTGDNQDFMVIVIEVDVVGDEEFIFQILFDNGMAAVLDANGGLGIEGRPDVAVVIGGRGQTVQAVDAGNGPAVSCMAGMCSWI